MGQNTNEGTGDEAAYYRGIMADKRQNFTLFMFVKIVNRQALEMVVESCSEFNDHPLTRHTREEPALVIKKRREESQKKPDQKEFFITYGKPGCTCKYNF